MIYKAFSLNGDWEMDYCEEKYLGTTIPVFKGTLIKNAVPGYWEDMTDSFSYAPFFRNLKINPEYGIQRYPIAKTAPDMALPNIIGNFYYRRTFSLENITSYTTIHFSGVQNAVSVWINGVYLERHEGYSAPFDIEIPNEILYEGENTVVLSVSNHRLEGYLGEPVSGLTSRAANECTGGITGDVEIRVYKSPLKETCVLVSEDCKKVIVKTEATEDIIFNWFVYDNEKLLKSGEAENEASFSSEELEFWTPETPKLYTLKIEHKNCVLTRKFGVRRLLADGVKLKLNNIPYFLRGVCEHCYFPETVHSDHDIKYYRNIIKSFKKLGFNFIRFHTYIPEEEYMQAADELGMLLHVECPNNTTISEWKEIVKFCQKHTSVVIYCCGNELLIDDDFISYLNDCADIVHQNTDSLFSPLSALRGLEYHFPDPEQKALLQAKPFEHDPHRIEEVGKFSDMYSSYANGFLSYFSLDADSEELDKWSDVYKKPRVSHEICIDGTYTDLSIKERYKNTRIGKTEMFSSIEKHLEEKGLLKNAPLYFKNSSEWQRRIRKYCFEAARRCDKLAGFDFLGPIDTHWHTFGYDVGMMNEFYELKPGETVKNVLMYNSPTVLLNDLKKKVNFLSGETMNLGIYTSHYGTKKLNNAVLTIRLFVDEKVVERKSITVNKIENGKVSRLCDFSFNLPKTKTVSLMRLYVSLDGEDIFAENEWELYLFPKEEIDETRNLVVSQGMKIEELTELLNAGKDILLLGAKPFNSLPTTFRISLAGRTSDNLATVIYDHPILNRIPHDGFCGWQFSSLMENGKAVCFEDLSIPFNPIIEVVSSHKCAIRQAALFEFKALNGKLLVCTFNFSQNDPMAQYLKSKLISYAISEAFAPDFDISEEQLYALADGKITATSKNVNLAFNANDKTAIRKKK